MISIIICSRNPSNLDALKLNVKETIGVECEYIVVDNSQNNYSIFSAYNKGVEMSSGNLLCFMHEDIRYHTKNWGNLLYSYFDKYPSAGMVGVAGSHYLPKMPAAWWDTELRSGHLLQGSTVNGVYQTVREDYWGDSKCTPTKVVSVDGLWMCFQKKLFDFIKWDDVFYSGFHGYDTDISLQVWTSGYEVHIFWDVLIEHMSEGVAGLEFYDSLEKLYDKWKDYLPLVKGIYISESEMEARLRIVELRHELFYKEKQLSDICKSREYRWSQYLNIFFLFYLKIKTGLKRMFGFFKLIYKRLVVLFLLRVVSKFYYF